MAIYTEEMTRLFGYADPTMPEKKNVRLLMRGVKQNVFAGLMRNPPKTVQELLSEATTIEKTLEIRIGQYIRRLIKESTDVDALGSDDLLELIRSLVGE